MKKKDIKLEIGKAAVRLANKIGAAAIIIVDEKYMQKDLKTKIPIVISQIEGGIEGIRDELVINLLSRTSTRIDKMRDAVMDAYVDGKIKADDRVVGIVGGNSLDAIIVCDVRGEGVIKEIDKSADRANPEVLRAVLRLALELGYEGKEGKQIGTAFILGDSDEVLKRSHQMTLNPYHGHEDKNRDVAIPDNWESAKNFAQLDGVFVIREDGHILAAGRYLDIDARDIRVQKGLGGRHVAAAAITRDTQAIAVTVSQSGGIVRIYKDGLQIAEIAPTIRFLHRSYS
ncbi:MAG: diadenylate cyclase [Methanocellales archaeon]|nr:diadenylate cyclase [Methanocellales archaeon]